MCLGVPGRARKQCDRNGKGEGAMAGDVIVLSEASTSIQATVMRCDNSLGY